MYLWVENVHECVCAHAGLCVHTRVCVCVCVRASSHTCWMKLFLAAVTHCHPVHKPRRNLEFECWDRQRVGLIKALCKGWGVEVTWKPVPLPHPSSRAPSNPEGQHLVHSPLCLLLRSLALHFTAPAWRTHFKLLCHFFHFFSISNKWLTLRLLC